MTHKDEPMTFTIPSHGGREPLTIQVHPSAQQDTDQGKAETNTGFVMWPSAVMLSYHLSQNPSIVLKDTLEGDVLELGSGCGLAGLTAAALLQDGNRNDKVIFTDYNPSVLDNLKRNIELNDFETDHEVLGLDWFDQLDDDGEAKQDLTDTDPASWVDMRGQEHHQSRLILGADLLVCSNDADLVAATIDNALLQGGQAIIMGPDASKRFGVMNFADACQNLGLQVEVHEDLLMMNGDDVHLRQQLELGGYNQRSSTYGHDFTMFAIEKPLQTA